LAKAVGTKKQTPRQTEKKVQHTNQQTLPSSQVVCMRASVCESIFNLYIS